MAYGGIKRWNGSSWVEVVHNNYNAGWNETAGYRWNGAAWVQIWPSTIIGADWPDPDTSMEDIVTDPLNASCSFNFASDGTFTVTGSGTPAGILDYLTSTGTGKGADYWVKYTNDSGSTVNVGGLTANTYYQMNAARQIGMERLAIGTRSGTVTIYIAEDSGGTGAVTWTGTITATVDSGV